MKREAEISLNIIKQLKFLGHFAYKTSDRFQIGLPDIYIGGGRWIETKRTIGGFTPIKLLRAEQKNWAKKLIDAGDAWHLVVASYYDKYWFYSCISYEDMLYSPLIHPKKCQPNLPLCLNELPYYNNRS